MENPITMATAPLTIELGALRDHIDDSPSYWERTMITLTSKMKVLNRLLGRDQTIYIEVTPTLKGVLEWLVIHPLYAYHNEWIIEIKIGGLLYHAGYLVVKSWSLSSDIGVFLPIAADLNHSASQEIS